jgi:hypothetical protein
VNARVLERKKANYAQREDSIDLRWKDGVFTTARQASGIIAAIEKRTCDRVFLDLLDKTAAVRQWVSSNSRSGNYAPKLFLKRLLRETEGFTRADFEFAMQTLFAAREIINVDYGRSGDQKTGIARLPRCAETQK